MINNIGHVNTTIELICLFDVKEIKFLQALKLNYSYNEMHCHHVVKRSQCNHFVIVRDA